MFEKKMKLSLKLQTVLLIALLIGLTLLISCAPKPPIRTTSQINYSPDFLLCVAQELEDNVSGPCTEQALKDWFALTVK